MLKKRSVLCNFVMYSQMFCYTLIGFNLYSMVNSNKMSDLILFIIPLIFTYLSENVYEGHNDKLGQERRTIELKDIKSINVYCISVLLILTIFAFNKVNPLSWIHIDNLNICTTIIATLLTNLIMLIVYSFSLDAIDDEYNNK